MIYTLTYGRDIFTDTGYTNDYIVGLRGNDHITSLTGSDTILAGSGRDYVEILRDGLGREDEFQFVSAAGGDDTVRFEGTYAGSAMLRGGSGEDTLYLDLDDAWSYNGDHGLTNADTGKTVEWTGFQHVFDLGNGEVYG